MFGCKHDDGSLPGQAHGAGRFEPGAGVASCIIWRLAPLSECRQSSITRMACQRRLGSTRSCMRVRSQDQRVLRLANEEHLAAFERLPASWHIAAATGL